MSLTLQRLNMDSSWHITWGNTNILLDPWLVGPDINYHPYLSEQWHVLECVDTIAKPYDAIAISQQYNDHCNTATLESLDPTASIYTVPSAHHHLKQCFNAREVIPIEHLDHPSDIDECGWSSIGDLEIAYISKLGWMPPYWNILLFKYGKDLVVYSPHGFTDISYMEQLLQEWDVKLLITSFCSYKLPSWLGGAINPGLDNALSLVEALQPSHVVRTHDEDKTGSGIAYYLSARSYPTDQEISGVVPQFISTTTDTEIVL
eukprot:TRINITY_DN9536_c0_g1_i1.p1 TRINITY_DN9536_c0_g1~~TRINITY_DN9536_c0_g1_i1.p1  ORF type:complete len:261 (-),score=38.38 TRINITY_DN9536_c0_g1_i1:132-914(-)